MATASLVNATWTNRATVKTSDETVVECFRILEGTTIAANEHVMITELPWGVTIVNCDILVMTTAGAACTADIGVYPKSALSGTTLTDTATGADIDGIWDGANTNSAGRNTTGLPGALLGIPIDEAILTVSTDYGEPVLVSLKNLGAATVTVGMDLRVILTYNI